jgi:hypothetical protein
MDLSQNKLTKTEWNSIEVPVSEQEKAVLKLIDEGAMNVSIRVNQHLSMIQYLKLDKNNFNESYLYAKYFQPSLENMVKNRVSLGGASADTIFKIDKIEQKTLKMMKKADIIRIENMNVEKTRHLIFEYLLIDFCEQLIHKITDSAIKEKSTKSSKSAKSTAPGTPTAPEKSYVFYLYTLIQFKKLSIANINKHITHFVNQVIEYAKTKTNLQDIVRTSQETIEQNPYLLKYDDMTLYPHQKQLFSIMNHNPSAPKLVLYMAPTGTGKTLSPVGLTKNFRVIFVCVARHVGLALAKAAISVEKKIAFAFGCETASDIRLHYFAATDYVRNTKSGGIYKVDNSVGDKVEMIICDVKSYLVAMQYMLAFNEESRLVTYWDEPTITMDYENHDLHETIHQNWMNNKISKMILSCATLPKEHEISESIMDFKCKFEDAEIYTIESYDCKKTISLFDQSGKKVVPHLLFESHEDIMECVRHCENNKSLLRYFDLQEILRLIIYANQHNNALTDRYKIDTYFDGDISNITMHSIKIYYLECLQQISPELWASPSFRHLVATQPLDTEFQKMASLNLPPVTKPLSNNSLVRTQSVAYPDGGATPKTDAAENQGIMLTTTDAHTLTDGPTIYIAEDIKRMGEFFIEQTKIPAHIMSDLLEKIESNNRLQRKIEILEKSLEDKLGSEIEKSKKMEKEQFSGEVRTIMNTINSVRAEFGIVEMDKVFVPNTTQHQQFWTRNENPIKNAFVPRIIETVVKEIMMTDVDTHMKMLLLLGIGMFDKHTNIKYMEIMKKLADEQKLFVIIASSDYIYGTNYQFCHGFVGKDLQNMTQQKIIQAMGRIGRNNIQQTYSVRFRDNDILKSLFMAPAENREAVVMSKLFNSE